MDPDDAYANSAHIPGGADYPDRWAALASEFRAQARCELDLPYGEGAREGFDLFHPDRLPRGLVVFVHGGYWKAFDRKLWSHLAAGPLARGWAVAMPSYDLCPEVRIADITRQIAHAIGVMAERVPGPLVLVGHSAGGHLVARMACTDIHAPWQGRVAHVMAISPLSDLVPLTETSMNAELGIDAQEAQAESPLRHARREVPVTLWVGGDERPAFLDQARWLAEAWPGARLEVEPGRHHFDVIEGLGDPDSAICEALLGAGGRGQA